MFRDAVERQGRPLTVAVAVNPPAGSQVSLSSAGRATIDGAAQLLDSLGHEIVEADIDYGLAALWNSTVRLLKGAHDDVASLPDRNRLERRTRAVARLGKAIPTRTLAKALAREHDIAAATAEAYPLRFS